MNQTVTTEHSPAIGEWERIQFKKRVKHAVLLTGRCGRGWHFGTTAEERGGVCVVLILDARSRSLHYPAGEVRRYLAMGYDAAVKELTEDLKALVDDGDIAPT